MNDRFNTIAGWLLGGGIVLLGGTLVAGEMFRHDRPETMGYPIEGVVEEGGADAEQPIAFYLQTADVGRGEAQFRKCVACHTINQGGASGTGPNLWATMGAPIAHVAGFNYSDVLRNHGGEWTWENMSEWIRSPRAFAEGTRMTFGGIQDPQARADLLLYMNQQGGRLQVPPPPAAAEGAAGAENASGNAAEPASNSSEGPAANNAAPAPAAPDATSNQTRGGGDGQPAPGGR